MLLEVIDLMFSPLEINKILDKAVLLCPAMKRQNKKMYAANIKITLPDICFDEERANIVSILFNEMVNW